MENRNYTLIAILVIVTAVAVSAADAAGVPKKAISTVSRFLESDLPTTTVFTDTANTLTGGNTFQHYTNSFTASNTGLAISNPSGSFGYILTGGAIAANRTLNLPVTTGTDTLATIGLTQTWTGTNTFNALTLGGQMNLASNTMISSGHVYTFPSNTGTVLLTNGSGSSLTGIVNSITGTANNVTASASTGAITLNLGSNAVTTGGSAQTFSKNLDLGASQTDKFGNTAIILRNPASTFATTLAGGAVTANRTLDLPVLTQTETIAIKPQILSAAPSNPTGTTSTTGVMAGLGSTCKITPTTTGRVFVMITGQGATSTGGDGWKADLRISSVADQTAPANAAALSGTVIQNALEGLGINGATKIILTAPITLQGIVTGLTPGSSYWIDIGEYAVTGGTASFTNLSCSTFEL